MRFGNYVFFKSRVHDFLLKVPSLRMHVLPFLCAILGRNLEKNIHLVHVGKSLGIIFNGIF
jgi:hypothetical protein